jgi:hypothetical protein
VLSAKSSIMPANRCAECGFDFEVDTEAIAARCEALPIALKELVELAPAGSIRRRPAPRVWAPVEYAAHIGETVSWYARRIERILAEDLPQLEPFDFDAAAEAGAYAQRSINEVVADLAAACQRLASIARTVSDAELRLRGVGSDGSPRSVASLPARADHEAVHHQLDLRRGVQPAP